MDSAFKDLITILIAVWGAITGSTAILLQIRHFLRDRANLKLRALLEIGYDMPPRPNIQILITNHGRRPATPSRVLVQVPPRRWGRSRFGWSIKDNLIILSDELTPEEVLEGRDVKYLISGSRIPKGVDLAVARSIVVEDKVGRKWRSGRIFGQQELVERVP
jgi:hypothetical protein